MFIDILAVGVAVGWALKGRLVNLGSLPLRGIYWFLLLGALQVGMQYTQVPERRVLYTVLIMVASVLAAGLLWINRSLPGVRLIVLGLALNMAVMTANGGRMPVSEWAAIKAGLSEHLPKLTAGQSSRHVPLTPQTRLYLLGDTIPLPKPYPFPRVISVGDVAIAAGVVQLIVFGMSTRHRCLAVANPGSRRGESCA